MNKNKIIFSIIGAVIIVLIVLLISILSKDRTQTNDGALNVSGFNVWTFGDREQLFTTYINKFREQNPKYQTTPINIKSFNNYNDYFYALIGAFLRGDGPDVFVLNNNDGDFFDNQLLKIDPTLINPDDFRRDYKLVFQNDLIKNILIDERNVDYLKGIPLGYQTPGLFYNFRQFGGKDLSTWAGVNAGVYETRNNNNSIGIGIGNGTTVFGVSDIITSFFIQDNILNLSNITSNNNLLSSLSRYFLFGDVKLDNRYDSLFNMMKIREENNLDKFSSGDLHMVIGYPSLLEEIDKKGYQKGFLRAGVFPQHNLENGKALVDYNYFVINKDTKDYNLSTDLLKYFNSEKGQRDYLDIFAYYLPSRLSLLNDRLDENLKEGYSIKYKDFYNQQFDMYSFDKKLRVFYDKEIINILDDSSNYSKKFDIFLKRLLCFKGLMSGGDIIYCN